MACPQCAGAVTSHERYCGACGKANPEYGPPAGIHTIQEPPSPPSEALSAGVAALYEGRAENARRHLEQAERMMDRPAVAAAYLALAHRIAFDTDLAREAIARAKEVDDACFEAYAAESVLLLTRKRLEAAVVALDEASRRTPYDLEGHFLKLLLLCLWGECLAGAESGPEGMRVDYKLTPVTKAAILILDGNAKGAPAPGHGGALESIASALLLFRNQRRNEAAALLAAVRKTFSPTFGAESLEAFARLG